MLRTSSASNSGLATIALALRIGSICKPITADVDLFEDEATDGMVQVVNVTEVNLPPHTIVHVENCNAMANASKTLNTSDPFTWVLTIDGPCVSFRIDDKDVDCDLKNLTLEASKLDDYCKTSAASVSVCKNTVVTPTSGANNSIKNVVLAACTVAALIVTSASV